MTSARPAIKKVQHGERDPVDHYLAVFRRTRNALPGSGIPWVQRLRDFAASSFAECGFPTTRWEEWKYTDTQPLRRRVFEPVVHGARTLTPQATAPYLLNAFKVHRVVFVDGHFEPGLSRIDALPAGAFIKPLVQALPEYVDEFESHFAHYTDLNVNPFLAINTMLMSDGVYIHLPVGAMIKVPIHVIYLSTADGATAQIRNLVLVGNDAEATIIEHYVGPNNATYWTNVLTEVAVGTNGGIEHYKLEEEGDKALHIAAVQVRQDRDSRFSSHNVALGGRLVRNDINTRLEGENARCNLNGLYVLSGRQHVDNHTSIDHIQPRTASRELYKGILDGWSRGIFNGKVIVRKGAQLTDSNQSNHNLLLSPNAEVDPKPQLEIFADDVKCSHGATVGHLDEDALYYLRSRGIPGPDARALLTYAFANDVITHMRLEPVRARVENQIKSRLSNSGALQE
jgi:Fe-S cluster assembly protein SufD